MNHGPALITVTGQQRLRADIERLRERLRDVIRQKADAAAETANAWHDNAGYEVAQAEEHALLQRIADLEGMLHRSTLVDIDPNIADDHVRLGSRVEVIFDDGEVLTVTIRGIGEVDLEAGVISASSPLGAALLNAHAGEHRTLAVQGAVAGFTVVRIVGREG